MKFVWGIVLGVALGWWLHGWQSSAPVPAAPSVAGTPSSPTASPAHGERLSSETLFATLLSLGANEQALAFLASVPDPQPYRQALLAQVQRQLQEQQLAAADDLLQAYLTQEFRDVDALVLQAKLRRAQQQEQAAIALLFQAQSYEHRQAALAANEQLIDEWVQAYLQKLRAAGNATAELQLWQFLTEEAPQRLEYVLALAQSYVAQGDEQQARQSLALLAADGRFDAPRQALLAQLDRRAGDGNGQPIPLQRQGSHFLLSVWLDGRTEARLMIDTGATMTVLRPELFARAGYRAGQEESVRQFNTANGLTQGAIYRVDELRLGEQRLRDFPLVALDLGALEADGLLGMDILGQYRFQLDQEANVLVLNTK